jgi:hypothetical protein
MSFSYRGLTLENGMEILGSLELKGETADLAASIDTSSRIHIVGSGEDIASGAIRDLVQELNRIIGFSIAGDGEDNAALISKTDFDIQARAIIYESLSGLPIAVLTDLDFWRYLAVVHLRKIVCWRFPNPPPEKFGFSTNRYRSMPFSLFLKGQLVSECSPTEVAHVDAITDVDIWASHVWGVLVGSVKDVVIPYLESCASLQSASGEFSKVSRLELRELSKRLTSMRSNIVFDVCDASSLKELVVTQLHVAEERIARRAL